MVERLFAIGFVLFGLAVFGQALLRFWRRESALRGLAHAKGIVVALEPVEHEMVYGETPGSIPSVSTHVTYRPTVEFMTRAGETRRCSGQVSVPADSVAVGEAMMVRYDPADPAKAIVDSHAEGAGTLVVPALIATGCLIAGAVIWHSYPV